jgi:hypothetical protein
MIRIVGAVMMLAGGAALMMGGQAEEWLVHKEIVVDGSRPEFKEKTTKTIGLKSGTLCHEQCVADTCEEKCDTHNWEEFLPKFQGKLDELNVRHHESKEARKDVNLREAVAKQSKIVAELERWNMFNGYTSLAALIGGIFFMLAGVLVAIKRTPLGPIVPETVASYIGGIPVLGVGTFLFFMPEAMLADLGKQPGNLPVEFASIGVIYIFAGVFIGGLGCSMSRWARKREIRNEEQAQAVAMASAPKETAPAAEAPAAEAPAVEALAAEAPAAEAPAEEAPAAEDAASTDAASDDAPTEEKEDA